MSNHVVAVVAGNTILPMIDLPPSLNRAIFEGHVDYALMMLRQNNFLVNASRAPAFLQKYGPLVAPRMTWTVDRKTARAAFARFVRESNIAWRNPALVRLSEEEVLRAPFGNSGVWPSLFRDNEESSMRGAAVGGIVMDAPTAKSTYLGRRTSRGTLFGPPVYYEPRDAAAIEAAFAEFALAPPRPVTPVKQERMSVEPASPGEPLAGPSTTTFDRRVTRSLAAATEVLSIHSSPPASPSSRPSKRPRVLESSPAPSAHSSLVPPRATSSRLARRTARLPRVREYIGAPPPDLAGFLARNDDDLLDSALPTSSARLEPVVRFVEPLLTPYSHPSSALAAREYALQRWEALGHHVRRITFLAREVINLATAEERLTNRPFGSPLEDPRAAHVFLPSAGAQRFADLPAVAGAYLAALEGVYLAPDSALTHGPASHSSPGTSPSSS